MDAPDSDEDTHRSVAGGFPIATAERSRADGDDRRFGRRNALTVVTNREPYEHRHERDRVVVERGAGGLVTALDGVLRSTGGTWVAWGSGDADFDVAEADDAVAVPPADPESDAAVSDRNAYRLRRVRLDDDAVTNYYDGFCNRVLWPLCHEERDRVDAEPAYWDAYRRANERFASVAVEETPADGVLWFHDYHFCLAPRIVRERLGDGTGGSTDRDSGGIPRLLQFWHVPWPPAETLGACPHARTILDGLLANDALGFHTERYRDAFLDAVADVLPAIVDRDAGRVRYRDHETLVYANPLGVDVSAVSSAAASETARTTWERIERERAIPAGATIALGVDRLDYTKGILERLGALERLWADHPEHRGSLTYVQKADETRQAVADYREYAAAVRDAVARVNARFGTDEWTPVVLVEGRVPREQLAGLYRNADLALVTSLRDGMNLVVKEYVAACPDDGVVVLGEDVGAAAELGADALTVDPGDPASVAEAVDRALTMDAAERRARRRRLRATVERNDVRAWLSRHPFVPRPPRRPATLDGTATGGP